MIDILDEIRITLRMCENVLDQLVRPNPATSSQIVFAQCLEAATQVRKLTGVLEGIGAPFDAAVLAGAKVRFAREGVDFPWEAADAALQNAYLEETRAMLEAALNLGGDALTDITKLTAELRRLANLRGIGVIGSGLSAVQERDIQRVMLEAADALGKLDVWEPITGPPELDDVRRLYFAPGKQNAVNEAARTPRLFLDAFSDAWPKGRHQLPENPYTHRRRIDFPKDALS